MATVDVLVEGYARSDGEASRVAGTVSLVRAPGFVGSSIRGWWPTAS